MNKIKQIIITSVKLMGFKIFEGPEGFNLANTSYIYGGNGQGKTSIADAIAYAFCGTSFWGEKTTDRLINNKSKEMVVQVDFVDENGELHTIIRRRKGNTTDITFDSHQYKQADLSAVIADKDIFLSALNPLYFIEKIAKDGREFLQKLLPPVSHESVIAAMSEVYSKALENESIPDPAYYIKLKKEKLKELAEEQISWGGAKGLAQQQLDNLDKQREELKAKIAEYESKLKPIIANQFKGIDLEKVKAEYEAALSGSSADGRIEIEQKRSEVKQRVYVSKVKPEIDKTTAELTSVAAEYNRLMTLGRTIRPGVACPTCTHALTAGEFEVFKADTLKKIGAAKTKGANLKSQLDGMLELDKNAEAKFEEFRADDLKKLDLEEKQLASKGGADIKRLARILKNGNYTDEQIQSLDAAKKALAGYKSELNGLISADELRGVIKDCDEKIAKSKEGAKIHEKLMLAAKEYSVKRAELLLKPLTMSRAAIKLFDVVKTTGEVKDVFKFTYDGKDYHWLSSSEQIKAGMEVAALIKRLTGLTYPTFIDNAECINTGFTQPDGQIIFAFSHKCKLTVQNATPSQVKEAA